MGKKNESVKIACENRKARHDYFIHETYEAGLELVGTEVKSLRAGKANLRDSYAYIKNGEIFLDHMHISPYEQGNQFNHDPLRVRRLLMHKAEILKRGRAKLELALASGKHNYDKRQSLKAKDAKREMEQALKDRQHG